MRLLNSFVRKTLNCTFPIILALLVDSGMIYAKKLVPYSLLPVYLQYNDASNADKPLLKKGFIDVTKAPYNAKGDNFSDDTQAIQAALNDAYNYHFVVYLPGNKTYVVSQQLSCVTTNISREYGYQMVGSTVGVKPVIRLIDNAATAFKATEKVLILYQLSLNGVSTAPSN